MKKSELYKLAIESVIRSAMDPEKKFDLLYMLYMEYHHENYMEELNPCDEEE